MIGRHVVQKPWPIVVHTLRPVAADEGIHAGQTQLGRRRDHILDVRGGLFGLGLCPATGRWDNNPGH